MRTDPSETGGLFIGRRPGTAPVRFRAIPERGTQVRQRVDGSLAAFLLLAMVALSLLCWGPIPLACLWIGSEVDYLTGSVFLGFIVAFFALFPMLFGTLSILRRLDQAWILVRRAAGGVIHRPNARVAANRRSSSVGCGARTQRHAARISQAPIRVLA